MDTELPKRKIQIGSPFVTSEPYIGHTGLGGVGDTKGLLESIFREHDIKWICNSRVEEIAHDTFHVSELDEDGGMYKTHELPHAYSMTIPSFRGAAAVMGIEGLVNHRGFVIVGAKQRNPTISKYICGGRLPGPGSGGKNPCAGWSPDNRLYD